MDRIEPDGFFTRRDRAREKRRLSEGKAPKRSFLSIVTSEESRTPGEGTSVEGAVSLEEAHLLLDEIHQAGERLLEEPTPQLARAYRDLIRRFMQGMVPGAFDVEEHQSGGNILKRKRFTLVKQVDQRVERLVAGILQTQGKQLDILARLEEIHGMLVDLMH
ncbi:MAG: YaaR family protein [Spirochaetaceae bacterium]